VDKVGFQEHDPSAQKLCIFNHPKFFLRQSNHRSFNLAVERIGNVLPDGMDGKRIKKLISVIYLKIRGC
jgi:hypothetical protein